jgi:dihydrofolate synthase/folylpolyglutamate synthase
MRFIHVVGTNGKGSFCCMLSNILTAAGYKTGLFTSPYIEVFNERMQIDGVNISDDELAEKLAARRAADHAKVLEKNARIEAEFNR